MKNKHIAALEFVEIYQSEIGYQSVHMENENFVFFFPEGNEEVVPYDEVVNFIVGKIGEEGRESVETDFKFAREREKFLESLPDDTEDSE